MLTLKDLDFSNKNFWRGFIATSFPIAFDEITDLSLTEIMEENDLADCQWWNDFTGYYDGILEETDGYLEHPKTFCEQLTPSKCLKVEFHPSDTVYLINQKEIACTGAHYHIQIFSFTELLECVENRNDDTLFLLLLPLVYIKKSEVDQAKEVIRSSLHTFFEPPFVDQITDCIIFGYMEES